MNIRKIARTFAQRFVPECELMEEGLPVLIAVEELIHTDEHPYCGDKYCPCYGDDEAFEHFIEEPFYDGLLSPEEVHRLYFDEHI